jgi:hypothetical protein
MIFDPRYWKMVFVLLVAALSGALLLLIFDAFYIAH